MAKNVESHVVIFRARPVPDIDDAYVPTVTALVEKARSEYGCTEFVYAVTPDGEEVAISFWPDAASIQRWKADQTHLVAQRDNRRWFESYRIQVGEIHRDYGRD